MFATFTADVYVFSPRLPFSPIPISSGHNGERSKGCTGEKKLTVCIKYFIPSPK
jgi:hypothetical protein